MRIKRNTTLFLLILAIATNHANAFIDREYSLQEVLDECTNILFGVVESVDKQRMRAVVTVLEDVKGKSLYSNININIAVGQERQGSTRKMLLDKLDVSLPIIIFYKKEGASLTGLGHVSGTWFQIKGMDRPEKEKVWWNYTHIEIHMHRTYDGSTEDFQQLLREKFGVPAKEDMSFETPLAGVASEKPDEEKLSKLERIIGDANARPNAKIAALFEAGRLHFKMGNYEEALKAYNAVINDGMVQKERLANVYYHKGLTLYKLERYDEAVEACKKSLNQNPQIPLTAYIQYVLGMSYMRMGNFRQMDAQARAAFEALIELEDKLGADDKDIIAQAHAQLGYLYTRSGGHQEAARHYTMAAERLKSAAKADVIYRTAQSYLRAKDYAQALGWYHKLNPATDKSNILATAFFDMAKLHESENRLEEAQRYYQLSQQHADDAQGRKDEELKSEDKGEILFGLGENLLRQGKYAEARNAYQRALGNEAIFSSVNWAADAEFGIAESYFQEGDYRKASEIFDLSIGDYQGVQQSAERIVANQSAKRIIANRIAIAKFRLAESSYRSANTRQEYQRALQAYCAARLASDDIESEEFRAIVFKDSLYGEARCYKVLGQREKALSSALDLMRECYDDISRLLESGDFLFELEKYEMAAIAYERALDVFPSVAPGGLKVRTLLQLALCYFQRSEEAGPNREALLRKAVNAYAEVLKDEYIQDELLIELVNNARYNKGLAHKLLGEFEPAEELFRQVVESDETNTFRKLSLLPLADIYESLDKFDDAIGVYEKATGILTEPNTKALAYWKLGELYRSKASGDMGKAISQYQNLVNEFPNSEFAAHAQYFTGLCHSNEGDTQVAIEAYQKTIQNYPASELVLDAYWNMTLLYDKLGDGEEVIGLCSDILAKYESSVTPHHQEIVNATRHLLKNHLLAKMNTNPLSELDVEEMEMLQTQLEKTAESAFSTIKERASAYFELGNLRFKANEQRKALEFYAKARELNPQGELLNNLTYREALAYYQLNEYGIAAERLQETLKLSQTPEINANALYLLGTCRMALQQLDEALAAFKKVKGSFGIELTLADKTIVARSQLYLGNIYSTEIAPNTNNLDRYNEAKIAYQNAISTASELENEEAANIKSEAYYGLALMLEREPAGADEAIGLYGMVINSSQNDKLIAEALYRRGLLYEGQAKSEEAYADLEKLQKYEHSEDSEITTIAQDAAIRIPNLCKQLGKIDVAISKSQKAVGIARGKNDRLLLAQTQYELASLYYGKAQEYDKENQTYKKLALTASKTYRDASVSASSADNDKMRELHNAASFMSGQTAYFAGAFADVIEPLKIFVEKYPEDGKTPTALNYLGWAYYNRAEKTKNDAKRKQLFILAADAFLNIAAITRLPNGLPESPQSGTAATPADLGELAINSLMQAGIALSKAKKYEQAIEIYQKLIDDYPDSKLTDDALYAQAGIFLSTKRYNAAIEKCQKLIGTNGELAEKSLYAMATCYEELKDYTNALQTYDEVIKRCPKSLLAANSQANIAHYYFNQKNYVRALGEYKKLTKFPGISAELKKKAKRWISETDNIIVKPSYDKAVAELRKAENTSIPLDKQKQHAKAALALFNNIVTEHKNCVYVDNVTVSIGATYEILEEWDKSLKAYQKIVVRYAESLSEQAARSTQLNNATVSLIAYAKQRIGAIQVYLLQKETFGEK